MEKLRHGADAPVRSPFPSSKAQTLTLCTQQINVFARENAETKVLNEELMKNKSAFRKGETTQDLSNLINTRKPFTWEALKCVGLLRIRSEGPLITHERQLHRPCPWRPPPAAQRGLRLRQAG